MTGIIVRCLTDDLQAAGAERDIIEVDPVPPKPSRLVSDVDATFEQQILNLPKQQRITDLHHHREADHLGRAIEISERTSHPQRLRNALRRLKPICSDKALPGLGKRRAQKS